MEPTIAGAVRGEQAATLDVYLLEHQHQGITVEALSAVCHKERQLSGKKRMTMEKIEITTPEPDKARLVLQDAIERHKRLLSQSITRTQERVQQLASQLQVDLNLLQTGQALHPEHQDMDLLELEGELEILHHLQEQVETLIRLTVCP